MFAFSLCALSAITACSTCAPSSSLSIISISLAIGVATLRFLIQFSSRVKPTQGTAPPESHPLDLFKMPCCFAFQLCLFTLS